MTESRYISRKLRGRLFVFASVFSKLNFSRSAKTYRILFPSTPSFPGGSSRTLHRILFVFALVFLTSCYSVRIVNKDGIPEPDPLNNSGNFYKGKKVHVLDTTVSLKLTEGEFYLIERCATGGFYSFEYRVTFGGVLLSAVTFGKKRRVKIKYVCLKEQN